MAKCEVGKAVLGAGDPDAKAADIHKKGKGAVKVRDQEFRHEGGPMV
jgi:hypothetical protein